MGRPFFLIVICLCGLLHSAHAAQIQMLPPMDFDDQPCNESTGGILQWDGSTSIKCIPNAYGLANGNIGIGTSNPVVTLDVNGRVAFGKFPNGNRIGMNNQMVAIKSDSANYDIQMMDSSAATANPSYVYMKNDYANTGTFQIQAGQLGVGFHPIVLNPIDGNVGIGTVSPRGNLDIENGTSGTNGATLCLNASCVQHVPDEVSVSVATLQVFNSACTGGVNTITADGAFTAWCTSACNRYCASLGHKGGLINEYDGDGGMAACGCF